MTFAVVPALTEQTAKLYGPRFPHDCDKCHYIGRMDTAEPEHIQRDVYFCPVEEEGTIILRDGEDGDYCSLPFSTARAVAATCFPGGLWASALLCYNAWQGARAEQAKLAAPAA